MRSESHRRATLQVCWLKAQCAVPNDVARSSWIFGNSSAIAASKAVSRTAQCVRPVAEFREDRALRRTDGMLPTMTIRDKLKTWAKQIKRDGVTLWFARKHPRTPWYAKALGVFVVAYALSPST